MTLLLALLPLAAAGGFGLDRVDLIASDPGTWINHDLPMAALTPTQAGVRFVAQVQPVWSLPWDGLYLGTSLSSQHLVYEHRIDTVPGLVGYGGVHTSLLLPRGLMAGAAWRGGPVRVALGASAISEATWRRPAWGRWTVLPTLGVGIGRKHGGE